MSESEGLISSMRFSMSSGVVSKPKASASGSVVVDDVTAAVVPPVVVSWPFPAVGGGGMGSKPRAFARESAADSAGAAEVVCPISELMVLLCVVEGFNAIESLCLLGLELVVWASILHEGERRITHTHIVLDC